jgi:membrane peptidoglycan carboxypeptidase
VNCKFEPNVNVATSERQPGSSFKPYMYLTGFKPEFGMTPMTKVLDAPISFPTAGGTYSPKNYDGSYHGTITIRKALAGSLNVPAVRTLATIGVEPVVKTAHDLGITSPLKNCGLSLVLGGCEVELVDHVGAFAVLANGGKGKGATPFNRIEDKHGKVLEEYHENTEQSVNPEAVYELISIMTDNLSRAFVFGEKSPLAFPDRPVACKTGTTQNWKDGWTLCFTPQLAAGVWAGNNDSSLMHAGADGVFVAAPMEHRFMELALAGQPAVDFPVPSGIVQIAYDRGSNKPATKTGKNTILEPFPWYALPKDVQISAAPKSLNKGLLTPIVEPIIPSPLTAPSSVPNATVPPATTPSPGAESTAPTSSSQSYNSEQEQYPDYGGLPNDYPTEPQAKVPGRPVL